MKKVVVLGAGFSGLTAASFLAKKGVQVTLIEKNKLPGGRAGMFNDDGFKFDTGPSWYWFPEIFEKYFSFFNTKVAEHYKLVRLDPSYKVFFADNTIIIPANYEALKNVLEDLEPGSAQRLDNFLKHAEYRYKVGIGEFVYKPSLSAGEFLDIRLALRLFRGDFLRSVAKEIHRYFKHDKIRRILEFPVIFLGAMAHHIPSFYSLMNYADIKLGTWYPMGGMYNVVLAFEKMCRNQGVNIKYNEAVTGFSYNHNTISHVITKNKKYSCDYVCNTADYQFVDQQLLPKQYQNYTAKYWDTRVMAPSAFLVFLGTNIRIPAFQHHNLVFDTDFDQHVKQIYKSPKWPDNPALYISCNSRTDNTIAPAGCENIIVLVPIAAGLTDSVEIRDRYYKHILKRLNKLSGISLESHIVYKKIYTLKNFTNDFNSFKGNAYGLANTLWQTAYFKPSMQSKKLLNLYHAGQLTVPGPGVPTSIISGMVAAKEILKNMGVKLEIN